MRGLLRTRPSDLLQVDHDLAKRVNPTRPPQWLGRLVERVGLEHLGIDLPGVTRLATTGTSLPELGSRKLPACSATRGLATGVLPRPVVAQ
jgi:hypothetical protein